MNMLGYSTMSTTSLLFSNNLLWFTVKVEGITEWLLELSSQHFLAMIVKATT